jgi:hypothetical protein
VANRFDLQNPAAKIAKSAARGQTYGKAGEQLASQSAVPMGASPSETSAAIIAKQATPLTSLTAPSQRPNEPITAGAPFGPGPNMFQAGIPMMNQTTQAIEEIRAIAQMFPSDDLEDLLARYGMG